MSATRTPNTHTRRLFYVYTILTLAILLTYCALWVLRLLTFPIPPNLRVPFFPDTLLATTTLFLLVYRFRSMRPSSPFPDVQLRRTWPFYTTIRPFRAILYLGSLLFGIYIIIGAFGLFAPYIYHFLWDRDIDLDIQIYSILEFLSLVLLSSALVSFYSTVMNLILTRLLLFLMLIVLCVLTPYFVVVNSVNQSVLHNVLMAMYNLNVLVLIPIIFSVFSGPSTDKLSLRLPTILLLIGSTSLTFAPSLAAVFRDDYNILFSLVVPFFTYYCFGCAFLLLPIEVDSDILARDAMYESYRPPTRDEEIQRYNALKGELSTRWMQAESELTDEEKAQHPSLSGEDIRREYTGKIIGFLPTHYSYREDLASPSIDISEARVLAAHEDNLEFLKQWDAYRNRGSHFYLRISDLRSVPPDASSEAMAIFQTQQRYPSFPL